MSKEIKTKEQEEELFKHAVNVLCLEIPVNADDTKELMLLGRAIQYADISYYCAVPKDIYERTDREIFLLKASCYFKRKKINPVTHEDREVIRQIENYEHNNVRILRLKYQRL